MKHIIFSFFAVMVLLVPAAMAQVTRSESAPDEEMSIIGAWNITYTLGPTNVTRQLRFVANSDRTGRFMIGGITTPTASAGFRAVWDNPGQMFNFSGEVRMPLSNVSAETGTLVFKTINGNSGLLNCQVVFVQNALSSTASQMYSIRTGTCVATPVIAPTP